jgi:hypothetical protein
MKRLVGLVAAVPPRGPVPGHAGDPGSTRPSTLDTVQGGPKLNLGTLTVTETTIPLPPTLGLLLLRVALFTLRRARS